MVAKDGPLKSAFDALESQGVVSHSLTTYRYVSGVLRKETVTRKYQTNGDYIDSSTSEPFGKGSSV
jgi:3-hydroxyisobutyrate dehydrogenase-like beta-hydroxyacid dehydrogenase